MTNRDEMFTLTQFFGIIVGICLLVSYFVADTHPVVDVPMVDETITHHHPDDIPVLEEDGL